MGTGVGVAVGAGVGVWRGGRDILSADSEHAAVRMKIDRSAQSCFKVLSDLRLFKILFFS